MLLGGSGRKKEKEKGRKLGNSKKGKRKEGWVKNFELGDKRIISRENKNQ